MKPQTWSPAGLPPSHYLINDVDQSISGGYVWRGDGGPAHHRELIGGNKRGCEQEPARQEIMEAEAGVKPAVEPHCLLKQEVMY